MHAATKHTRRRPNIVGFISSRLLPVLVHLVETRPPARDGGIRAEGAQKGARIGVYRISAGLSRTLTCRDHVQCEASLVLRIDLRVEVAREILHDRVVSPIGS